MIFDDFNRDIFVLKNQVIKYDIDRLQKEFIENIYDRYDPCWQDSYNIKTNTLDKLKVEQSKNYTFGGWSLLSDTGHMYDGWFPDGYLPAYNLNIEKSFKEHKVKTEICQGIFSDIIDDLVNKNYRPSRARISISKKNNPLKWHNDSSNNNIITRIHIPIITNPTAVFMSKSKVWYLPADGSVYLLNTNHLHRNENHNDVRFHIIIDVSINDELLKDFSVL